MRIREVHCKTALSPSSLPGIDYSLNPYRGCEHACIYCYVPSVLSIPRDEWGGFIDIRRNIPTVLAKELKKKRCGTIGISTVTDPYQPIEKKYRLIRLCLEQLIRYDFPIDIQTKSDLVLRDLDLISKLKNVEVGLTIPTLRDEERRMMEPKASSIEKRLQAVRVLSNRGIKTYIFFGPAYPTIEIDEVEELVEVFYKTGTNTLIVDSLHLKSGVWENLEKNLPNEMMQIYKKRLFKEKNYYKQIFEEIEKYCKRYGIRFERAFGERN